MVPNMDNLEWWVDNLAPVYQTKLKGRTPVEVWSKVAEHGSGVGEAVREANFRNLVTHLGQTLGWLCIFLSKAQDARRGTWGYISIPFKQANWDGFSYPAKGDYPPLRGVGDIAKYHYPRVCPHCGEDRCRCALGEPHLDSYRATRVREYRQNYWQADIDQTWSELEDRFARLYSHDDKIKSYPEIGFHFLEEIGEVGKALRMVVQSK
jgi:hypothetical protein